MNKKGLVTRAKKFIETELQSENITHRIKAYEALLVLNPNQRKVFLQRFAGRSMARIAFKFDISRERVKQIEWQSIKKMEAYLHGKQN